MTAENQNQAPAGETAEAGEATGQHGAVNVQALADRVYKLMLREIRLEQARGEEPNRRRRAD
ncbi:MAG: hypothetical protein WBW04_14025 [Nitrolancea sp.]